jgi:hypothetical protein
MGTHMKTTVEISTELLSRAKRAARHEDRTLRDLIEEGLDLALLRRSSKPAAAAIKLPTSGGDGLTPEFAGAGWEKYRDEIYRTPAA